ncbi:hypothetical protein ALI144C_21005 [Actinosynnema sp. ALI-1.44]|nr:hypothetical protein ALI144C_21005 [Actinosynnema sp. ALI-1.44]
MVGHDADRLINGISTESWSELSQLYAQDAANVLVVRVRDGLTVHSRDFHNHHALAKAVAA